MASRPVFLVLAATIVLAARAYAGSADPALIERVRDDATPAGVLWNDACGRNAALAAFRDSLSLYGAAITAVNDRSSKAVAAQEGSGHSIYRLVGEAYHRLAPTSAVWGRAAYSQTSARQIRFADIIDYRLVGPYTLGDDTGGDMRSQRYEIGGGWSRLFGKWGVGLEASYRAETAHRSRDPRVRDIVSDLRLSAGTSLKVSPGWIVGLKADFTSYKQDADVEFMNSNNKIITRLYTGLGNVYKRFGGNTVTQSSHSLKAFGAGAQLISAKGRGLMADISFNSAQCDMYLKGYNNIKPAYTETMTLGAGLAWAATLSDCIDFTPSARTLLARRRGVENLFNTAEGGNYAVIGNRENYRKELYNVVLRLPLRWHTPDNALALMLEPVLRVGSEEENLHQPKRTIAVRHVIPGAVISADRLLKKRTMLRVAFGCDYRTTSGPAPVLTGLDTDSPEVISNYDMLRARVLAFNARATFSRAIGRTLLNLDIHWRHERYRSLASARCLGASLSINF